MCPPTSSKEVERDSFRLDIDPGSGAQPRDQMMQSRNRWLLLSTLEPRYGWLLPAELLGKFGLRKVVLFAVAQ